MKEIIKTDLVPQAIGPYSQAIMMEGFLYTSGQIALDPITGKMIDGGIEEQTVRVIENLKAILEAAGMGFNNVVKTTVFITNMDDFDKVNRVYGRYFGENPPARSCVEVSRLPKNALIEIELIAHK